MWFDLCAAVEEALLLLTLRAQRKGVALETEVAPELSLVHGDHERICDAIYHLADNAIKYTPPGGTVQVRCWADDGRACLDVQDTGVGIPADVLPTLWEAFAQAADPVRRGLEGLGLGLALVQYVVTEHGGEVHAESEVGVGSTFGFWLPCCGPEVAPVAGLDDTEAPGTVDTRSALAR